MVLGREVGVMLLGGRWVLYNVIGSEVGTVMLLGVKVYCSGIGREVGVVMVLRQEQVSGVEIM